MRGARVADMVRVMTRRPSMHAMLDATDAELRAVVGAPASDEARMVAELLLSMTAGQRALLRARVKMPPRRPESTTPAAPRG